MSATSSSASCPPYFSCFSASHGSPPSSKHRARTEEEPTSRASTDATRRIYPGSDMAVVIASNIRKEIAGKLLFEGISFSVERRDRVALSGPNGAGKTTLLRILAGETEKHGGELAFAKGTRIALHDQRPPLERELTLREYVLSGAADLVKLEQELASLEQAMAQGTHDQATLNRYSTAQARLEHAGG